jgi:hypothetical protein
MRIEVNRQNLKVIDILDLLRGDQGFELVALSEEVGFEPTKHFRVYTLSKRAPSATRTLLQEILAY